jgi:hypothetical protein
MSSDRRSRLRNAGASAAIGLSLLLLSAEAAGPRFYPDDPLTADNDTAFDASGARPRELSEGFDFVVNQFGEPGDLQQIRAVNINTLDEAPDSSWFTNRIGQRPMSIADIARGPDRVERLDIEEWIVTDDKGPAGFQPGFRAVDARDTRPLSERQVYQLELDTEKYPDLATGAEMIGTTIYHAIGYNVVDLYLVNVDPRKVRINPEATVRDVSGERPLTARDVEEIFKLGARNPDGTYRMTASRFVEGRPMGNFTHFGTRPDDPNDIYPHEHRRELRANRVFGAWIQHDDSRAPNTLDQLVSANGKSYIKHYMFDFGAILGSSPDRRAAGFQYLYEGKSTLAGLATLGLWTPSWEFANYPKDLYPYVGLIQGDHFDPERWKPSYPNRAFSNMRPDDAFWAARIVAQFSDEALAAIVKKAQYREQKAADYLLSVLIKRRDKVVSAWLNGVNPLVNFRLAGDGALTFDNAALAAKTSTPPTGYAITWSRFDNATDAHEAVGTETTVPSTTARAPQGLETSQYVAVSVKTLHPDRPVWAQPVRAYFRRDAGGWTTVGLERTP